MPARRANVLLVDDQADNLVALAAVLEPLGHNLVKASSGEEALKLLLKTDFAVILLDVHMPGLDGFETARLIKERGRTRHVPIIFVTGLSKDTEHIFRGYSEGAVDYLLKPYDPAVLRSKVAVFTQLREQTVALEASEQRFRTAFANAPGGMALVSADGRVLQANRALAQLLGRELGELEGAGWAEIVHPESGDEALAELLAGASSATDIEQRFLHADGRELLMALRVSPLQHRDSEPAQVIVQLEDVTERRRAELERAERLRQEAARVEAEAVANMVRDLQHVSDAALAHLALEDLLPELIGRIGEILGADGVAVLLTDPEEEEQLVLRATHGIEVPHPAPAVPVDRSSLAGRAAKERRAIVIADLHAEYEGAEGELRDRGVRSLVGVPLIADGEVGGVLRLGSRTPHFFDGDAVALLTLVADRAALAIGNARLYDREHRIAETLQRSLLPARLPRLPGVSIAARYMPGGADVGGDWYDAIALEDGSVGLAMGDVVGHGIEAAALMGELRNSLRAFALDSAAPREVVGRLDRLVKRLSGDQMATLLYAVIDPAEGTVRYTCAGHPPPLVLGPDGSVEHLWEGRSPLLGLAGPVDFEEGAMQFADGSTLALYTDGLVEVPGEDLETGLARLRA
ncbi:MAG: SpoIIE family protein phosphatase, partial [Actinomycetota bacterium]|nr:SpoIIE family protein phosphatase [Actinomycetota bacterium]